MKKIIRPSLFFLFFLLVLSSVYYIVKKNGTAPADGQTRQVYMH